MFLTYFCIAFNNRGNIIYRIKSLINYSNIKMYHRHRPRYLLQDGFQNKKNPVNFAIPRVPSQSSVVKRVEAIVVGNCDISTSFQEYREHVIPLLADGIMQRCVSLRVLQGAATNYTLIIKHETMFINALQHFEAD